MDSFPDSFILLELDGIEVDEGVGVGGGGWTMFLGKLVKLEGIGRDLIILDGPGDLKEAFETS